ncbi:TetR/AcrR family transcriptional regulator [Rhizobium sp. 9140]|uniref:TetR/AcrR family transcriptional regulator n=1 Tax=Rhizobium sp. 9140 TaxID=1761900 RepID=UPI00079A8EF4|nr:TetR/AcrR family transcriptional regulator [Rhizobium sp. 9140]CZT35528.1 transcriptional regulator, TetR family [Rhizobium sp. 9140]
MSICGYSIKKKLGRPAALSEAERRDQILAAAEQCFVSQGYRSTHMDDVVKACGMSKKTVYRSFGTKENLFVALIDRVMHDDIKLDMPEDNQPADAVIGDILSRLSAFVLSDRQVNITRLVISESAHAPELAAAFHDNGLRYCKEKLTGILSRLNDTGRLKAERPSELASLLVGAIIGESLVTALIRRPQPMTEREREGRIDHLLSLVRPSLMPNEPDQGL